MGYAAAPDTKDVSNSNTPGANGSDDPVVPALLPRGGPDEP